MISTTPKQKDIVNYITADWKEGPDQMLGKIDILLQVYNLQIESAEFGGNYYAFRIIKRNNKNYAQRTQNRR